MGARVPAVLHGCLVSHERSQEIIKQTRLNLLKRKLYPLDWPSRQQYLQDMKREHPALHGRVIKFLAADEALEGQAGPHPAPENIVLGWRQLAKLLWAGGRLQIAAGNDPIVLPLPRRRKPSIRRQPGEGGSGRQWFEIHGWQCDDGMVPHPEGHIGGTSRPCLCSRCRVKRTTGARLQNFDS